ncbi:efflux RND transporter periplasmic adaptor subunit [Lysobacter sp. A03]|uniref:efflux RND transporter periplasmic adaptor subunit n=1 Tax=Lysobacter sp. A03 TaxID=1199154 RepID=UPI0005B6B711|nr:efflux RND transporter periplasmic adaptor subunit [Lysobacter sp. A03]KIQ96552.1 putative Co/Zn/Cd efflux system membrane fusion protein [Lysobacter sp. A03]
MSEEQIEALGIESVAAQPAENIPVTGLPGEAVPPFDAVTQVTVPFTGVVTRILVDEGERVRAGQPLLRIQSRELIAMQGDLARARAEAGVSSQQARRDAALAGEGIIPEARLSESSARASAARVTLDEANAMMSRLRRVPGGQAGEYDLLAPQSGLVLRRSVTPGQAIEAMAPAFVLVESDALDVQFNAPIALRGQLQPGLPIRLANGIEGEVVAVGADTDTGSQTLRVRAHVDQPGALVAGQQLAVTLLLPAAADAVSVPQRALHTHGQGDSLYVQDGSTFRRITVERMGGDADTAVVRSAGTLRPGDLVVQKGGSVLKSLAPIAE